MEVIRFCGLNGVVAVHRLIRIEPGRRGGEMVEAEEYCYNKAAEQEDIPLGFGHSYYYIKNGFIIV